MDKPLSFFNKYIARKNSDGEETYKLWDLRDISTDWNIWTLFEFSFKTH